MDALPLKKPKMSTSITVNLMKPAVIPSLKSLATLAIKRANLHFYNVLVDNPKGLNRLLGPGVGPVTDILKSWTKEYHGSFSRPEIRSKENLFPNWRVHKSYITNKQTNQKEIILRHAHLNKAEYDIGKYTCGCSHPDRQPLNETEWVAGRWNVDKNGVMKWQERWKNGTVEWPEDD